MLWFSYVLVEMSVQYPRSIAIHNVSVVFLSQNILWHFEEVLPVKVNNVF